MSTDFNYPCKFTEGSKVKITSGFHTGKIGKVVNVDTKYIKNGFLDSSFDEFNELPRYEIKVGWFRIINVTENQLELL